MTRIAQSVVIQRPVDEVWQLITDMEALSRAGGGNYRQTSPGPFGVGSTIEEVEDHQGPAPFARVTDFQPNRSYSFAITGDLGRLLHNISGGYTLDESTNGTQLTWWYDVDVRGIFKIVRPIVSMYWARGLRKPLASIKSALETDAPN